MVVRKLEQIYGDLSDIKITILGITYKPGTSTLRRSVALDTIKSLISLGSSMIINPLRIPREELFWYFLFQNIVQIAIHKLRHNM